MGPSHEGQPGMFRSETQDREQGLKKERDRSGAPFSIAHLEPVNAGMDILGSECKDPGPYPGSLDLRSCNLGQRLRPLQVLRSKTGILSLCPDMVDGGRLL